MIRTRFVHKTVSTTKNTITVVRTCCRQCGLVFCLSCAGNFIEIPEQQLYEPVRVCTSCYQKKIKTKDANLEPSLAVEVDDDFNAASSPKKPDDLRSPFRNGTDKTRTCDHANSIVESQNSLKDMLRDSLTSGKTCSQESLNVDSNPEGNMLMDARVS